MKKLQYLLVACLFAVFAGRPVSAAEVWEPAVHRGVQFLKTKIPKMTSSEAGIAAFTMFKAHVPANDLGLVACFAKFGTNFNGTTYTPEAKGGAEIYEACMAIMAMANIDRVGYKPYIDVACEYILRKQMPNGAWDISSRTNGDIDITQYALLGLWEGEKSGVKISPNVWDNAAKWCISVQAASGSWNQQRDQSSSPESVTMTGAGVGSLIICQRQLAPHRKGQDQLNPLMTPVEDEKSTEGQYKVETTSESVLKGIKSGIKWMGDRFQTSNATIVGVSVFECLYSIERVTALAESIQIDTPSDWYKRGVAYVLANQTRSGSWESFRVSEISTTCCAMLFTVKATEGTIQREQIRKMLSGQPTSTLPANPDELMVVGGQLTAKPLSGTVESILTTLEDPEQKKSAAAMNGLMEAYQKGGTKVIRVQKDRFRKLANSRDEDLRKVAIWGLGRSGDLDVAPLLIKALLDPNEGVMNEARSSMEILSRKLDGFGPEPKASREEKQAAAIKWQQWFESVKPPDLDSPNELPINAATASAK